MITGINHVTVIVKNKEEAEEFYIRKLGLTKVIVGKSLWAKAGNQFIHISENKTFANSPQFSHFAICVDDLREYLTKLVDLDVEIFDFNENMEKVDMNKNFDKEIRNFFAYDPSGNLVEFVDSSNHFFSR